MTTEKKAWYKSKVKTGTIIIAIAPILATIGGLLTGNINLVNGLSALSVEVGVVWTLFGFRDLPFINRTR